MHVLEGPLRRPVVDPDGADLVAPAALVQRGDDVLAGTGLGQRRAGVLQVQEHLVGGQALGLLQEPGVAARDGEVGTAGSELGHGASTIDDGYRRVTATAQAIGSGAVRGRDDAHHQGHPDDHQGHPGQRQQRRQLAQQDQRHQQRAGHLEQDRQAHHGRPHRGHDQVEHGVPEQLGHHGDAGDQPPVPGAEPGQRDADDHRGDGHHHRAGAVADHRVGRGGQPLPRRGPGQHVPGGRDRTEQGQPVPGQRPQRDGDVDPGDQRDAPDGQQQPPPDLGRQPDAGRPGRPPPSRSGWW